MYCPRFCNVLAMFWCLNWSLIFAISILCLKLGRYNLSPSAKSQYPNLCCNAVENYYWFMPGDLDSLSLPLLIAIIASLHSLTLAFNHLSLLFDVLWLYLQFLPLLALSWKTHDGTMWWEITDFTPFFPFEWPYSALVISWCQIPKFTCLLS